MDLPTNDLLGGSSGTFPGSAFSEYCNSSNTLQYYGYQDYQLDNTLNTYNIAQTPGAQSNVNPLVSETLTPWSSYTGLPTTSPTLPAGITFAGAPTSSHTPKRKRKTTPTQRLAANNRERRRMCNLNVAFDKLRRKVPTFPHEKRLSRIQTLKLAMTYIGFMTEVLTGQDINVLLKQQEQTQPPLQIQPDKGDPGGGVWQPFNTHQVLDPNTFLQTSP